MSLPSRSVTMPITTKIVPCLWFDQQGEEAATFYTGIFPRSKITKVSRYPAAETMSYPDATR